MWYGNATQSLKDEAEAFSNKRNHEKLQERLAGYAAVAAIAKAKREYEFRKATLSDRDYPKRLKPDTIRKRIARGDW